MKVIASKKDVLKDAEGNSILSLKISNFRHQEMIKELDESKDYSIEIKEVKNKRSLAQNRYMWALIREIDIKYHGRPYDDWSVYIMALERAGAKCDYIAALPEIEEALKQNFRAIKRIKEIDLNGHDGYMYKVFIGSSKMDVKEMNLLIDTLLDMAEEVGIETSYYESVLR